MPYVYLILSVFMSASSSIFGKLYNKRTEGSKATGALYNFLLLASVCIGWGVLYATDFSFDAGVLIYSALFAIGYIVCSFGLINALKHGPATLSSLLVSLSLILTTIWGFLFWDAEVSFAVIVGLVLVVCSIVLCLYTKGKKENPISLKWLIYISLAFFGNAACSIVQRTQQTAYHGQHGKMLMFFAMSISVFVFFVVYLKSDRSDTKAVLKTSFWAPVCAGMGNLVLNLFVMLMAVSSLSPSLIYPVIGVGSLAVVTVFSLFIFKEKMYPWQWVGVGVGACAVLLLSI